MSDSKPATTARSLANDGKLSNDRNPNFSMSSIEHGSTFLNKNSTAGYTPSYHPVYYPGSYNHLGYPSASFHNQPPNPIRYSNINFFVPNSMTMTLPSPHDQNWNRFCRSSPLTTSAKGKSISKPHAKKSESSSTPPKPSKSISSNQYIDPKILDAAHALKLPPGGQKYSVTHWKDALRLCYRWKTTTNEHERQFYRTSTSTNSLSSSTLKSIKFFCENILQRKSKRRQFAIHWKESGLKKLAEEVPPSDDAMVGYNDPKLERIIDDYFSGRTRSMGYNQAKERVLDERQNEILHLWDELMSGPALSLASSHQKLYLIQLAIERPYSKKKVEIETSDQKIVHDVAIEGYGGKSYWEKSNSDSSPKAKEKSDILGGLGSQSVDGVLPINEAMIKRFWKCSNSFCTTDRQGKKRRIENGEESNKVQRLSENACILSKNNLLNTRESDRLHEDKENERSSFVAV